ncbi:MAG: NADPH:quinone oxidoreductase family protein [Betaproteobacteria bacterium]|nr:MAG: NADPH:quinone oxidoreductase family protein [Betaproteobacteria bacterium]
MKAVLCRQFGPPESLVIEELPAPEPGAGEVVVTVKAASVNFPDVLIIQNKYQVKPPLPFSPGSELAGIVKQVGEGVTNARPGDRVIAFATYGAFAEECLVPAARLLPIPAGMDFVTAAAFILTYGTSHHALRNRAATTPGETLLVLGAAGGVGIAAIEIGKVLGLRVIACASSDEKLAVCRQHGADEVINYAAQDLREGIKRAAGARGVDVIYDAVGGPYAEAALRSSNWRARLLVIGFASGEIPKLPLNLPLLMERSIIGVYWGEWSRRTPTEFAAAVNELGTWYAQGRLKPHVSSQYPLEQAAAAISELAARRAKGKVVIVP